VASGPDRVGVNRGRVASGGRKEDIPSVSPNCKRVRKLLKANDANLSFREDGSENREDRGASLVRKWRVTSGEW